MKKILSTSMLSVAAALLIFASFTEISIYKNLKAYGYGASEVVPTTLVYLGLSDGYTVDTEDGMTQYIGRHNAEYYDDLMSTNGYECIDRMGTATIYQKDDTQQLILATDDRCHWFRVYKMGSGHQIEDFEAK